MKHLAAAKYIWRRGNPIPVDLAMRLAGQGYDVHALEQEYLK